MNVRYSPVTPLSPDTHRSVVGVGLLGIGLIHTLDLPSKWHETPYLAAAYVVVIGVSLLAAAGMLADANPRWDRLAVAAAACPLAAYIVSRTVGLPAATGDIGNWLEPLGVASLFVEATVLVLVVHRRLVVRAAQSK